MWIRWFGHVKRMCEESLPRRKSGRKETRWKDEVNRSMGRRGFNWLQIEEMK